MVDLAEIQTAYYMVAATGVLVAAIYYMLSLRQAIQNRKAQLFTQLVSITSGKEFIKDANEILSLQWIDFDDFAKKYDSGVNIELYSKRAQHWGVMDSIGFYLRKGQIDIEQANSVLGGFYATWLWDKYGDLIKRYRVLIKVPDYYVNFEYLAVELHKFHRRRGYELIFDGSGVNYSPND
jgi:hypothetical protein